MTYFKLIPFMSIWCVGWYVGLCFFIWVFIWKPVKTGEAGSSGMKLNKNSNPVGFWLRIAGNCLFLVGMAILPVLIILMNS